MRTFKLMKRNVFAHAIVNFGAHLTFHSNATVKTARVFLGGATNTVILAGTTSTALLGKALNQDTLDAATAALIRDIDRAPSASKLQSLEYKKTVATGFLFKVFLAAHSSLPTGFASALENFTPADARPVSSGAYDYGVYPEEVPVSTWAIKQEADIQASGEATYASDQYVGAWFAQIVVSERSGAKLLGLDARAALSMPGVRDFVTASDIPVGGVNCWTGDLAGTPGTQYDEEKIFFEVNDTIPYVGAQLGVIVAETWAQALAGARAVKQWYSTGSPAVISSTDARRRGLRVSKAQMELTRSSGVAERMARRPPATTKSRVRTVERTSRTLSVQGGVETPAQIHFQLETKSAVAVPTDGDSMELFISGQDRDVEQSAVALALGIPRSQVNVINTRIGAGFGGKLLWQCATATAVAVAANKLGRPVRFQNERRQDMQMAGTRNSIDFSYDTAFDADGKLKSCDLSMSTDGGWIPGFCFGLAGIAGEEGDVVYNFPNGFNFSVEVLLTNKPAVTWMRAPGTMQTALFSAAVLEHVAKTVGKEVEDVMEMNFYKVGDHSCTRDIVFGENKFNFSIPQLWAQIKQSSKFAERKVAVVAYNQANKWKKKGIAMVPSKMDMGSTMYHLGAHISAYTDGTVHVSTGGVEVGQGLNTKVALVVAMTLGLPVAHVRASGGDTRMCSNSGATGGSGTSESCCNAAMQAAKELKSRVQDKLDQGMSWVSAIQEAKNEGQSLQAEAWFDGITFSSSQPAYSVYGTGVAEVVIDVLTGETRLERVDLLMDLGHQLDAAVDIGQIQGGFVITLGYLFTEETKWDVDGTQLFCGTWEYKVPTAYDIPVEFNVSLLKDTPNPKAMCLNSKAVAEPAMSLVSAPYLAVKQAIYAAREEFGLGSDWFQLNTPLSSETIRAAIGITESNMRLP